MPGCRLRVCAHASHDARSARTDTWRKRARRALSSAVTWYSAVCGFTVATQTQPSGSVYS